ncbi:MAG TPA: adenylosuccinate lyase [Nitriliruptorales bacterium]|nr:adenylosuccinate lyase [Nitriliruptorales bacterium]
MAEREPVTNVLAERYASPEMRAMWSPRTRVVAERRFWLDVLRAQRAYGVDVPDGVIEDYEAAVEQVDLDDIAQRERVTRHDVKARIEAFNALAGHQHVHRAMTSRDLTENVEQLLIRGSLALLRDRAVALLARLAERAAALERLVVVGRTHNVPAQATTVGKRFADAGQELLLALRRVEELLDRYPLRGLKGPVGTQQDQLDLLGDAERVEDLEVAVAERLGFREVLSSVGQVYPRSLDLDVVAALVQLAAGPSSLATTLRLMSGQGLVDEGTRAGQVGSSAMPHKVNTRSCERINGLMTVLTGHLTMVAGLAGDRWNEGDVSDSVVRRVALRDAFLATDGLFETFLTVLTELTVFEAPVARELSRELPFLATTRVLGAAVAKGMGREDAHAVIREHSLAVAARLRDDPTADNDLLARLAAEDRLPLGEDELAGLVARPLELVGTARRQVQVFVAAVEAIRKEHPRASAYQPRPIL